MLSYKIGLIANTTVVPTQRHREKEEEEKIQSHKRENLRMMEGRGGKGKEGRKQRENDMYWNSLQTERPSAFAFLSSQKLRLPLWSRLPHLIPN